MQSPTPSPSEGSATNRGLVVLATLAMTLGTATAGTAQMALDGDRSPFRFEFEQTESPRGVAVEGYV